MLSRYSCFIRRIFYCILLFFWVFSPSFVYAIPFSLEIWVTFPEVLRFEPLIRDDSMTRFVSREVSLNDRTYRPDDLVSIASEYIDEKGRKSELRAEANDALQALAYSFYEHFGQKIIVVSAYRSAEYQTRLWDLGRCTETLCAPPWQSEHQLWLAIDIFETSTEADFFAREKYPEYFAWMQQNAHFYGFIQSYKNGVAIDGYEIEPWHWRYVGTDLALKLHSLDWNLTQYRSFLVCIWKYGK